LVAHLTERLSGDEDGKPKVFRGSAVANLTEFFERLRHLNVGSNEQLIRFRSTQGYFADRTGMTNCPIARPNTNRTAAMTSDNSRR
jgi:hypothetical protein